MQSYYIAIEGGGTRSTLSIISPSLEEVFSVEGPSIHAHHLTKEQVSKRCSHLIDEGLDLSSIPKKAIRGIGLALAGGYRKSDQENIKKALSKRYSESKLYVTSDVHATHRGAFEGNPGILVIAGTGSIVLGFNGERWQRAGGYGWRLGDEGSGHQIGVEGLRAVGRDFDGQSSTRLTHLLAEEFNLRSREELIAWTYDGDHTPSKIAPHVIQAAREEDSICQNILRNQLDQLCELVQSLSESLIMPSGPVTYHGGLFESDHYRKEFATRLREQSSRYQIQPPEHNPRIGLYLMMQ